MSLLGAQGADINYIADQVGHTTTRLTQNLYTHVLRRQPRPPWRAWARRSHRTAIARRAAAAPENQG